MRHILRPNFKLPQLSLSTSGCGPSPESVRAIKDDLRLLIVDGTVMSKAVRARLFPEAHEIHDWYFRAAESGVALVVLCGTNKVELYSTSNDRRTAFFAPLLSFTERAKVDPELARIRVVPRRGLDVARHLFEMVAGLDPGWGTLRTSLTRMTSACQLASQVGALSPSVDLLFRAAMQVSQRVQAEAHCGTTKTSRQSIGDTDALRIIDEELLNWKTSQLRMHRTLSITENFVQKKLDNTRKVDQQGFLQDDEAPSGMRIRVAPTLDQSNIGRILGISRVLLPLRR